MTTHTPERSREPRSALRPSAQDLVLRSAFAPRRGSAGASACDPVAPSLTLSDASTSRSSARLDLATLSSKHEEIINSGLAEDANQKVSEFLSAQLAMINSLIGLEQQADKLREQRGLN